MPVVLVLLFGTVGGGEQAGHKVFVQQVRDFLVQWDQRVRHQKLGHVAQRTM
jgi:hypothetical protein